MRGLRLALRVAAGLALLAAAVWIVDPHRLATALARVDPALFAAAFVVSTAAQAASAVRWAGIARALDLAAPVGRLLPMYFRGMTSNALLPGATVSGDALRAWELSRAGNPLLEAGVSVAFDRLSGLWTLCVLSMLAALAAVAAGLALATDAHGREVLTAYGLLLVGLGVAPFLPWPLERLGRTGVPAATRLADLWRRWRDPATGLRRRLARTLGTSFVVQLLSAAALALGARAVGVDAPWLLLFAAAAPIFVMGALPLGISGFGTRELAAVAVLGAVGVPGDLAAATGLIYGIVAVLQGVLSAPLFLWRPAASA
ncbi:MAG: flippase-like domain-containing protein [Burkholderiales bacterium]|nr:flippase-like domain-containing protein [Burkholderiales bacterium]